MRFYGKAPNEVCHYHDYSHDYRRTSILMHLHYLQAKQRAIGAK